MNEPSTAQDHVVLDALRQTVRCLHCRGEDPLPGELPLAAFIRQIGDVQARHRTCVPTTPPPPTTVRLAPGGCRLERDHQGLWTEWTPASERVPLPYQVRPLSLTQVAARLTQLRQHLETQPNLGPDDRLSLIQIEGVQHHL